MKAARAVLLVLLAPLCLGLHDLLTELAERLLHVNERSGLGFGIYLQFTGWVFILSLPICILFGEVWWRDKRRYLIHVLLLCCISIWSLSVLRIHPNRTMLFLMCCWATLPGRWLINRWLTRPAS